MSDDASYLRCKHCKGFYETSFPRCKWCNYDAPFPGRDGSPRVFSDRETCRAIQMAEFEQLPPEAHADPMGPPKNDLTLLCACLHCGEEGHRFEAVEMRWMANERMWACPCTTCGGRGFGVDIHSAEDKWQCVECGHFYLPPNGDHRSENAKCPKCGCTEANGWFDDGYEEEFFEETDVLEGGEAGDPAQLEMEIPWEDEPARPWGEGDGTPFDSEEERMLDDIDYPRTFDEKDDRRDDFNEGDIPF
jgi:hypothetical protein